MRTILPPGIDSQAIAAAERLIRPHIRRTPVIEVEGGDFGLESTKLVFKLESLQHAGSFKTRGAFANVLGRKLPPAGVVAASGGNHGAAVAYPAGKVGVAATIFVPHVASAAKIARIRSYGAALRITGERYSDARRGGRNLEHAIGRALDSCLRPAGNPDRARHAGPGAGAAGSQSRYAAGGGRRRGADRRDCGLVSRTNPDRCVEPEKAPTLSAARAAGRPVDAEAGGIATDSLAPKRVGELMFPLAQAFVGRTILVTDEEIEQAQRALWGILRVASEPGGAAALSALLSRRYTPAPGERVGVLVCGGNTTAVHFGAVGQAGGAQVLT